MARTLAARTLKINALVVIGLSLVAVSCAPYAYTARHVYFESIPGLDIYERSGAKGTDRTLFATQDVPIRYRLRTARYALELKTYLSGHEPVVVLRALSPLGATLRIQGSHVGEFDPAILRLQLPDYYPYSFNAEEALGAPLDVAILDAAGAVLGHEILRYKIRSRGIKYGVEGL